MFPKSVSGLFVRMICFCGVCYSGSTLSAEAPKRETWHLELRGIGGGSSYKYPYSPICFSPDSRLIAISLGNHPVGFERFEKNSPVSKEVPKESGIGIWRVGSMEFVKWIKTSSRKVIRFSADGRNIAALDESRLLRWDIESGTETATTLIEEPSAFDRLGHGFAFLPDDRVVAARSEGIAVFSIADGRQLKMLKLDKLRNLSSLEASDDGQFVVADSYCWNLKNDTHTVAAGSGLSDCVFRPKGQEVWGRGGSMNAAITTWQHDGRRTSFPITEGLQRGNRAKNGSAQYEVACLAFSPNGKVLGSVGKDRCIHLWNASTGVRVATLEPARAPRSKRLDQSVGRPLLDFVLFSPDGKWLLASSVETVSMFRIEDIRKHINANKIHRVTQYFAGSELFEEIVTNPPGLDFTIGTTLNVEDQTPGTRVAALRRGDDKLWYDAVILAKASRNSSTVYYDVHFEGYGRDDDQSVAAHRIRPKLFPDLKLKDTPGRKK